MMPNATPIEVLFTAIVAAGVACNAWCVVDALKDRRAVVSQECTEMAWLLSNANVRTQWIRLFVQVSFLAIAFQSLLMPPPLDPRDKPYLFSYMILVRIGFFISTIALAVHSVLNVYERRRILTLNGKLRTKRFK